MLGHVGTGDGLGNILWFQIQDSPSERRAKSRHWKESRHSSAKFIALDGNRCAKFLAVFQVVKPGLYQVFRLSEKNLRGLDVKEDIQLVYGKVYTLSSGKENWPGNKQKVKKAMGFQEQTWYDSAGL